jgi:hypothetical protein
VDVTSYIAIAVAVIVLAWLLCWWPKDSWKREDLDDAIDEFTKRRRD